MALRLGWDLFCRVIDNYGDIGVCWRLAADLASRGDAVRLFADDASALAWMAPQGHPGVQVLPFDAPAEPADVVVEAFGCDPPAPFVAAMAETRPVWINLEYLSAEDWVERSHGLPSPQRSGLVKWFFFPGFTPRTGGLLREPGLMADRAACDRRAWLAEQGIAPAPGERLISLFCYEAPGASALLATLADRPGLVLQTPGPASRIAVPAPLRAQALPWLTQADYDRLLWSCDLNLVRGEDSLVRAVWAGAPFVWHIYPQHDGAHRAKLEALLARMDAPASLAAFWRAWNGFETPPSSPDWPAWQNSCRAFRDRLATEEDLTTRLRAFALGKARGRC